jgi:hypothetical protein
VKTKYSVLFHCICPSDGENISYKADIFSNKFILVEDINTFVYGLANQELYQEHLTDLLSKHFDCQQRELIKKYSHLPKHLVAPVWHMSLSLDWLLEIANNYDRFCFGSSGAYWQVGSESWCRRADQAWNELTKRGFKPWVHMMRGLALCGDIYPFASADSTNVARNFKNNSDLLIECVYQG